MNAYQEILALLKSDGDIPRERVLNWIASKDLDILAVLYVLTDKAYWRIKPELGMIATCNFIKDYLLRCLAENPDAGDYVHSGYEAASELAGWLKHLKNLGTDTEQVIREVASDLEALFRRSDREGQERIINGFLEHVFEKPSLRRFFDGWRGDPELGDAYTLASEWGDAHLE